MTGYQKLKKENEMLWEIIEKMIRENHEDETSDEIIQKEIAWIKWKIEHETNQEKN